MVVDGPTNNSLFQQNRKDWDPISISTSYLSLKCDYFHIENKLPALFVGIFLVNLLEWNVLQSRANVIEQRLLEKNHVVGTY